MKCNEMIASCMFWFVQRRCTKNQKVSGFNADLTEKWSLKWHACVQSTERLLRHTYNETTGICGHICSRAASPCQCFNLWMPTGLDSWFECLLVTVEFYG